MKVARYENVETWIDGFYALVSEAADMAAAEGKTAFDMCLAGGSTPRPLYQGLASRGIAHLGKAGNTLRVARLWLGDERAVAHSDNNSNFKLAASCFAGCGWAQIFPWPQALNEEQARLAAQEYQLMMVARMGKSPVFDCAVQGIGLDGHTASLFPGDPILAEKSALASVSRAPNPPTLRMSLTLPALATARQIIFIARGADKAGLIDNLVSGKHNYPAHLLDSTRTTVCLCLS